MINKDFLNTKINAIKSDLEYLMRFQKQTFNDVAKNFESYTVLKHLLMEIIGRGIDINEHLIAELQTEGGAPLTYKETFLKLGELAVLPKDLAEKIAQSAGFRNAIVHDYNNLDKQTVFKTVGEAIEQYGQYCQYILDFLENDKNKVK